MVYAPPARTPAVSFDHLVGVNAVQAGLAVWCQPNRSRHFETGSKNQPSKPSALHLAGYINKIGTMLTSGGGSLLG
jgi:hypothetical protein